MRRSRARSAIASSRRVEGAVCRVSRSAKSKPTCGRSWIAGSSSAARSIAVRCQRGQFEDEPAAERVADPLRPANAGGVERLEHVVVRGWRASRAAPSPELPCPRRSGARTRKWSREPLLGEPAKATPVRVHAVETDDRGRRRIAPLVQVELHQSHVTGRRSSRGSLVSDARRPVRHPRQPGCPGRGAEGCRRPQGPTRISLGGDFGSWSPWPRETIERLRGLPNTTWIRGNGERWLREPPLDRPGGARPLFAGHELRSRHGRRLAVLPPGPVASWTVFSTCTARRCRTSRAFRLSPARTTNGC